MTQRFAAVLFDCDGVLVDSEPLTMGVLRDLLEQRGWKLTLQECMQIFVGKATRDEEARIERETGQPFTTEWLHGFWAARDVALRAHLQPVAGAPELVQLAHTHTQGQIACVSGADRDKITLQLALTGLTGWFQQECIFSGHEFARSKPHPDIYLAAMQQLQVPAGDCLVIEDSITGVQSGAAAGAQVVGYASPDNPVVTAEALRQAGAFAVVTRLSQISDWLR